MTEKRFRAVVCVTDWYIEDKEISPFAVLTPHQSSDLLNKLYNENKQLKEELADANELKRIYVDFLVDKGFELSDVVEWSKKELKE